MLIADGFRQVQSVTNWTSGIKKSAIAKRIVISERALYNKLSGSVSFTWEEVMAINTCFFPDFDPTSLFARAEQDSA